MKTAKQNKSLNQVEDGLRDIGYDSSHQERNYVFADVFADTFETRTVDLAAFARSPFSYESACIAATCSDGRRKPGWAPGVRALGAPLLMEINAAGDMTVWQVRAHGNPETVERCRAADIPRLFDMHREDWEPETLYRAKAVRPRPKAKQLDFVDLGLMPAIDEVASEKLHSLLLDVIATGRESYRVLHGKDPDYARLFALVFRFLAAKLLSDRGLQGDWLVLDAPDVLERVECFYSLQTPLQEALQETGVQEAIWRNVRRSFHFENVSVDTLAYVYENTLVTSETREIYGTHSTPRGIAAFLVENLPFENLPPADRHVLEPCAGHGVFLVSAMHRLRELLPQELSPEERHEYFVEHLRGMELDRFACEVCRLSLMLADYPNPDGWRIQLGDVFADDRFEHALEKAEIVLANPPFQNFAPKEQKRYRDLIRHAQKPAELLARVLDAEPAMIGFVLPRVFVNGRSYQNARNELKNFYGKVSLITLPDNVFAYSEADSVLLLASGREQDGVAQCEVTSANICKGEVEAFLTEGRVENSMHSVCQSEEEPLWVSPLTPVWEYLSGYETLGAVVDVHRGIEYNISVRENREQLISSEPQPEFRPGLENATSALREAFLVGQQCWLNLSEDLMRGNAYQRPWEAPKIIANAVRSSRSPWRIRAAPDRHGLVCTQAFHGIWPHDNWPIETLAAVINGPVANAFVNDKEIGRHNRVGTVRGLPLPGLDTESKEQIRDWVRHYVGLREAAEGASAKDRYQGEMQATLQRIDASILSGYELPPRMEKQILSIFDEQERPVGFDFEGFYPRGFRPCIPYAEFVSRDFQQSEALDTLARLKVVDDEAVHDMVVQMEETARPD